jgi:IrrE N-terminal-like domain
MVTRIRGRPVIIITKKAKADWALFILAHEIGHIAKGHLGSGDGEAILDETISNDQTPDQQEREANEFASGILTPDGKGIRMPIALKAEDLASAALRYGREHGISPGHVILNAAKHTRIGGNSLFALGNAALHYLPAEVVSRPTDELCREAIQRHVKVDSIKSDSIEFLEKLLVL